MRTRAAPVGSTVACTLLLVAVPAALIHLAAWPNPEMPTTATLQDWVRQPLTTGFLTGLAYVAAWGMWVLLASTVAARTYTRVARALRWLPTLHLPGPLQGLTAAVLGATAVTASTGAIPAHAATSGPGATTADEAIHPSPPMLAATSSADAADKRTIARVASGQADTYTVRRGDTLSDIAEQCLGDANRWPEMYALNRGTHFSVGGTLRDPDVIYPGWTLDLPTATTPPSGRQAPPAPEQNPPTERHDADEPQPDPDTPTTARAHPTPASTAPDKPAASSSTPSAAGTPHGGSASPAPTSTATGHTPVTAHTDPVTADDRRKPGGVCLPSGSWIDVGLALAVAAAVALVWVHRRRRYIPGRASTRPCLSDPDLAPMPRVINQIRRALRPAADHPDTPNPDEDELVRADINDEPTESNSGLSAASTDDNAGHQPVPLAPALGHQLSSVWPAAGLGLTGPGAHAAARGFLTAALGTGGTEQPAPAHT